MLGGSTVAGMETNDLEHGDKVLSCRLHHGALLMISRKLVVAVVVVVVAAAGRNWSTTTG